MNVDAANGRLDRPGQDRACRYQHQTDSNTHLMTSIRVGWIPGRIGS
jgi:hypothetical protein